MAELVQNMTKQLQIAVEGCDKLRHSAIEVPIGEPIVRTFKKFNFGEESGLLQFWACRHSFSEDTGCNLMLTDQPFELNLDHNGDLQDYRFRCLEHSYPFVGLETRVGNWLPGRAAQTGIADQWTMHHVLYEADDHSIDVGCKGQLVMPVFCDQAAGNKLVGIIEYVTLEPKESYVEDFEQIHNLLKDEGLESSYMGKVIKFAYDDGLIKFTLPLSAKCTDLHREVTRRLTELKHRKFRVEYEDDEGIRLPISSDEDLRDCMAESSSKGAKSIRMCVLLSA